MSTRRVFILQAVAGIAAAGLGQRAFAQDRPMLAENDPEAIKFSYTADASKVDPKKFPDFKAGDRCNKCQIYEDEPNNVGGCPIFTGKRVAGSGWCSSFS